MSTAILTDFTDKEKGAYLGAIASLATADHKATEEELNYLSELATAAGISDNQKHLVAKAASEITDDELQRCLEILRESELRFSLVAELISFAKTDGNYDDMEKNKIEAISQQLGINNKQFSLLDDLATQANKPGQEGILDKLGLGDKFKMAGMNFSSISKGILALAAPLLLGKLLGGKRTGNMGGGMMGGGLMGAGLGSLLSMLSGGRGFGSTGGLLSKILKPKH